MSAKINQLHAISESASAGRASGFASSPLKKAVEAGKIFQSKTVHTLDRRAAVHQHPQFFFRDNGVGFDLKYEGKRFR